jgi:ABC-type multidrug transport system fused ATPase/permease subunit
MSNAYSKIPAPKSIREVPHYLYELFSGFFTRFFYIVRLVWRTGHWIPFLLSFVALFRGVTPVIGAVIAQKIINQLQDIIPKGYLPRSEFWNSGLLYLLIALLAYRMLVKIVNYVTMALNRIAGEKVIKEVRCQIMNKSKEIDLASYDNPFFYEKMENANREAGMRPLMILTEIFGLVSSVIELVSFLIILFAAPGLFGITLVILLVSIPSAIVNFIYRRKNFKYMRFRSKERRQMNYYSSVIVDKDLVKEIRLYDLADTFIDRFLGVFKKYYNGLRKLIMGESIWQIVFALITGCADLVFYIMVVMRVFSGEFLLGDYTLYTGAIASVATCVTTLINSSGSVYEGTLFIDNLISFMNEKQKLHSPKENAKKVLHGTKHTIEFDHVTFRYPGTSKDVLKDISFVIRPSETMALVGLNGAGKTTLIKLLTRLYDPTDGRILLDGVDIREYELTSLYKTFGIIFQDYGKYAFTVEENIRFGDIHKNASMDVVKEAAVQSTADVYVQNLPNGYETPLMRIFETNGMELSIGQWQKLAVARAFYADSDVMILDEPTASLDAIAEQEIFNQFDKLRNDKTTIFVSHRLSSATIANQIIVLENGSLIEKGTHAQLMEQKGKYYELFSTQSKRYLEQNGDKDDVGTRPREGRPERSKLE